jgi:predicted RNA-binding protein YlqC (UPF0109 family)
MQKDQEFLEYVIKALVDEPEKVKVNRTVDEMGVLLTLEVSAVDMGKIIGRQGNTAKSIRTLLRVVGMKNNSRVNLKINEPEGGLKSPERMAAAAAAASAPASAPAGVSYASAKSASPASKSIDEAMADLKLG